MKNVWNAECEECGRETQVASYPIKERNDEFVLLCGRCGALAQTGEEKEEG